jgi:nucleoside-diphosphate-sugar epimerase
MNIFLTGASGYIGGALGARFTSEGHAVRGLVRNPEHAAGLSAAGITPVVGTLDDSDLLAAEAGRADAVVNAADSDHRGAVDTFVSTLRGSGKVLLHTSGSSLIGDDARGEAGSGSVVDDATAVTPDSHPIRRARFAIDTTVVDAGRHGVRSAVLCNSLIYGTGVPPGSETVLIPPLVHQARDSGVVRVVGRGLNRWSTVHIDDMATLYALALVDPRAEGFYFVENGDASFGEIGTAIARRLGLGPVRPWSLDEASAAWGEGFARFALGSNSRVRATRAQDLGWAPKHTSVTEWIEHDMPVG